MSIYGSHTIPVKIVHDDFDLSIEEFGDNFIYRRKVGKDREEKLILGKKKKIQINPVPPLTKPTPDIFVDNLGDSAVNIIARIWAPVTEWYELKMTLLWKIKKALEEQGIEIAFPQRTVWFASELKSSGEKISNS